MHVRRLLALGAWVLALAAPLAAAAPFDVYYRAGEKGNWIFYGGRDTRAAADAAAAELGRSSGFETKVVPFGEPTVRPAIGPAVRESIAVGGTSYLRRPGLGYSPGWYRHGGVYGAGFGVGIGGGGWGGGWGGGYGGYGGSSSHHHHSSHHHSHEHHSSSHHSGSHPTAHPAASARGAGGRGGSSSHHSHSHSHSHSHHSHSHSHGGHHK